MSEDTFLAWLRQRLPSSGADVLVGSGPDDCAVIDFAQPTQLAISTDTIVEGTHFSGGDEPRLIGWKAMAAALSDLAASGCTPGWGLISAAVGRGRGEEWLKSLAEGMIACAEKYGLAIVGGDTVSAGLTCLTVTVMGKPFGASAILRSGAQVGDVVAVTGTLGGSISGRHLRVEPRFAEIEKIIALASPHACMDISDGLSLDLSRLTRESGCGARIFVDRIPVSDAARDLSAQTGRTPLSHALEDGEDFELLFTLPPDRWEFLNDKWNLETPLTEIGEIVSSGLTLVAADGAEKILVPGGYTHEF
jgi:thiamine-monophosphate kinase